MRILPEDHFYMKHTSAIRDIWRNSLFKDTDITYFNFARVYKNGWHATLPSDPKWFKHYWDQGYGSLIIDRLKEGVNLWSTKGGDFSKASQEAKMFFNIDHKVDLVRDHGEFYDLFGFATYSNNDSIINFYLNNMEKLEAYCSHFYACANDLLVEAVKREHLLKFDDFDSEKLDLYSDRKNVDLVLRCLKLPDIGLSWRQLQVCILYLRGRSWNEISELLGVDGETARVYLKKCKEKLGAKSRSQLYDVSYEIGLHKLPMDYILGLKK